MQLTEILTPEEIHAVSNAARARGLTDQQFITAALNEASNHQQAPQRRDGTLNGKPAQTLLAIEAAYASAAMGATKRLLLEQPRPIANPREGYALMLEALEDAWLSIKENRFIDARNKVMRLIALAFRFMAEC